MIRSSRFAALTACLLVPCLTVACGEASFSPTSPSGLGASSTTGAVITGTVQGLAQPALSSGTSTPSATGAVTVSVAGTDISSGVDGTGRFTLSGVPSGPIQLQFRGAGIDATITLAVNAGERIELTVSVTATGIRIEAERRHHADNRAELEGHITAIDAAARTLRVAGALVEVPASAVIRNGSRTLTFADLRVGDEVEIHGHVDGSRIIATTVEVEDDDDGRDDDDEDEDDDRDGTLAEVEGVVSALSGSCPNISFTLRTVGVRANSATRYEEGACAHVQNNVPVEVLGQRQADGSLLAVHIEIED